ncbi:MAG: dTDP-4-dehydrorhamnose 3,5-epimerase family protein [Cytophagales bacterium]
MTNKKQLLVPHGFADGFLVVSEEAEILYKCDEFYHPECEGGLRYDEPALNINLGPAHDFILSQRIETTLHCKTPNLNFDMRQILVNKAQTS